MSRITSKAAEEDSMPNNGHAVQRQHTSLDFVSRQHPFLPHQNQPIEMPLEDGEKS